MLFRSVQLSVILLRPGRQAAGKQEDKLSCYQDTNTAFRHAVYSPDWRANT